MNAQFRRDRRRPRRFHRRLERLASWLEVHWVAPSYQGWLALGLALFFFAAATNAMAGWLYIISGTTIALLGLAVVLVRRSLRGLEARRSPIEPVSAGGSVAIALTLRNTTATPKTLLQLRDDLPAELGGPVVQAIDQLPAQSHQVWRYDVPAPRRGLYRWDGVQCRSAAPFGLCWYRATLGKPAQAVVYPTVLPLGRCPLVDAASVSDRPRTLEDDRQTHSHSEGLTRSLRPYRWGDAMRTIHWRTSARHGELRVREQEIEVGGPDALLVWDTAIAWDPEDFEQAAIAAASLYFYASRRQTEVQLWTAATGLIRGNWPILTALAAAQPQDSPSTAPPNIPAIWLTADPGRLHQLPAGSRWLLWAPGDRPIATGARGHTGMVIDRDRPLDAQLQTLNQPLAPTTA